MAQCANSTGVVGIKAMEGPSDPPADEDDDLFADGGDEQGAQGSEGNQDNGDVKEVPEEPTEALDPKLKNAPCLPSPAEVEKHCATHLPYRNWCPICVQAKAREDAHRRADEGLDAKTGHPVISMDYAFLENKVTMLIVKDDATGCVLTYDCTVKGPGDAWVLKQLSRDLEDWGRTDIHIKTDGEPAMLAVQKALAVIRSHKTLPINPPEYSPQSNGAAEKAVQDVVGQARCLLLGLEARIKENLDPALPLMKWLLRHAAFLLTRYSIGHDGLTAWRRLTGKNYSGTVVEFGERVFGKLALKRPATKRKAKRGKQKLAARSVEGTWVGIYPRTGEHIVVRKDGEAIRVRTVHRVVEQERWNSEMLRAVRATPRLPNPDAKDKAEIEAELVTEPHAEREDGGAELGQPQKSEAQAVPRELRITDRLLEKYGYPSGCPGCIHKQLDLEGHRGHTAACRTRIYELMRNDEEELDRLAETERRLGRQAPEQERIRRPTAPDAPPEPPRPAAGPTHGGARRTQPMAGLTIPRTTRPEPGLTPRNPRDLLIPWK